MTDWLNRAKEFGVSIREQEAVTFMLGAGCSLSSGAPTLETVLDEFHGRFGVRLNGLSPSEGLHRFSAEEQQEAIDHLFEDLEPNVGYLSLCALARTRRVCILNLNWEDLVGQACGMLGVKVYSFDLQDVKDDLETVQARIAELPLGEGVVCAHVHGMLSKRSCRYARLNTLAFSAEQKEFLQEVFWANPLLIAGASLSTDTDIEDFLVNCGESEDGRRIWFFGRDESPGAPEDLSRFRKLKAPAGQYTVAEDLDFDRTMLKVLEAERELSWPEDLTWDPEGRLEQLGEMALVKSRLLRGSMEARVLLMSGVPRLGKTTLASHYAHCRKLWAQSSDLEVRHFSHPTRSLSAISSLDAVERDTILIIEDPFGSGATYRPNPTFLARLRLFLEDKDLSHDVLIIVTSRSSHWNRAVGEYGIELEGIQYISSHPDAWYSKSELLRLCKDEPELIDLVEGGRCLSPLDLFRCRTSGSKGEVLDSDGEREVVDEITKFLSLSRPAAELAFLVGLQRFSRELLSEEEILRLASLEEIPERYESLFGVVEFEGTRILQLDHFSTREACTQLFRSEKLGTLENLLRNCPPHHPLWEAGKKHRALFDGADEIFRSLPDDEVAKLGADYFSARPCVERLTAVLDTTADEWSLLDCSYEVAAYWEFLPKDSGRRAILEEIVSMPGMNGVYALFEARLYLQRAIHDELASFIDNACWGLWARRGDPDVDWELSLLIDGLMWRPLRGIDDLPEWAFRYLEGLAVDDPAWALIRFLSAFHAEGVAQFIPKSLLERDLNVSWTPEQARFAGDLVRWHFVHQAYFRGKLSGIRPLDKAFLCRTTHPGIEARPDQAIRRFLGSLAGVPAEAGWAFYAGVSLRCWFGGLCEESESILRKAIANSPDGDVGVLCAVLQTNAVRPFRAELRTYFSRELNRNAILDAMVNGVEVLCYQVAQPRFFFVRSPADVYADANLEWPDLTALGVDTANPRQLAFTTWKRLTEHEAEVAPYHIDMVFDRVSRGDLRQLEENAVAARPGIGLEGAEDGLSSVIDTLASTLSDLDLFGESELKGDDRKGV